MVANYPNASVFYPANPVGIDAAIFSIQSAFANRIAWLSRVFGRATAQSMDVQAPGAARRSVIVFPEVYQANDEPMNAMPNDNFDSQCFFTVKDPGEFMNYDALDIQTIIRREISIIFWCDLGKINPYQQTGRFNESLIIDVVSVLKSLPEFSAFRVYEQFDQVFDNFTVTEEYKQFMKLPYTAFRISGFLSYPAIAENVC